jgi:hypothetical protein
VYSGLFRTFASTPPTLEGIQDFANKYGHLGEGSGRFISGSSTGIEFDSNEEREEYQREMERLSIPQLSDEWKAAIAKLRKAVDLWEQVRTNDADSKTAKSLEEMVDGQLNERRFGASFEISPRPRRQSVLNLVPYTLCGAMWLQFAQSVAGDRSYRACGACGRYLELSPGRRPHE